jgi:hypothetical protein
MIRNRKKIANRRTAVAHRARRRAQATIGLRILQALGRLRQDFVRLVSMH